MSVTISPTTSDGMLIGTIVSSSKIQPAPQALVDPYPLDISIWQRNGSGWVANGNDKVTINNTTSANDFLNNIYHINQSVAHPVTFRLIGKGDNIAPFTGDCFSIELILTDSGGLGGTILGTQDMQFPVGTWTEQQFSITLSPVLPAPSAPSLVASASGGTLATGTVYVKTTAVNTAGETIASLESSVAVTGTTGSVAITITPITGATAYNIYASSTSGTEKYSGQTATTSYTLTTIPSGVIPPATNTAAQPAVWLYAYIFTRNSVGQLTFWDAEIFDSSGIVRTYGEWRSPVYDLTKLANIPVTTGSINLTHFKFYYSDISNVDGINNVDHSIEILSKFDAIVFNEPGLNTTTQQQAVQNALIQAGIHVFGYCQVGASSNWPTLATMEAIMDRCAAAGYYGVFYDMFGYDWGVARTTQNTVVNYAHSKGLKCIANAWIPADALGSDINATYNPSGSPSTLGVGDWYLFESFYCNNSGYVGIAGGGFYNYFQKYTKGIALAKVLGVSTLGLSYAITGTALTNFVDWINAYILAVGLGLTGLSYDASVQEGGMWMPSDFPIQVIGKNIITTYSPSTLNTYEATTDQGIIQFIAVDSPISRSTSVFKSAIQTQITVNPPATNATKVNVTYYSSVDGINWIQVISQSNNMTVSNRYFQFKMELWN